MDVRRRGLYTVLADDWRRWDDLHERQSVESSFRNRPRRPPSPTPSPTPLPVKLKISPSSLDFGTVEVGTHKGPKRVIVRDPKGDKKTPGLAVAIVGVSGGGGPFSVEDACGVSDLSPGDACSFSVTFAPTAAVSSTATVMIIDNAEQQSVKL